jgi:endonuclease YncB( thermonuclease family)
MMGTRSVTARLTFKKDILVRGAGFAAAAIALCGALGLGSALRGASGAVPQLAATTAGQDGKDQTRVSVERLRPAPANAGISTASIWYPGKIESAPADNGSAAPAVLPAEPLKDWQTKEFNFVSVVDGRTFRAEGLTVTLAGLDLPPADQVCRTLDNRLEQCVTRATTQLELLTRSRTLACRYRMTTSSEATGSCRIGANDLAERMIRTGYTRSADGSRTVVANAQAAEAAR